MATNNRTLYLTAHAAAVGSMDVTDALALDKAAIAAFVAAGHDDRDYARWNAYFYDRHSTMTALSKQNAESTIQDKKTAQEAEAQAALLSKAKKPLPIVPAVASVLPLPKPIAPAPQATQPASEPAAPVAVPDAEKPAEKPAE